MTIVKFTYKGGKGSGHFGHSGRPGKIGGSTSVSVQNGYSLNRKDFIEDDENIVTTYDLYDRTAKRLAKNWNVDSGDLNALILEENMDVTDDDISKKEALAYYYVRKWGGSSGGPVVYVMIDHIATRLGIKHNKLVSHNTALFLKDNPGIERALQSFADAMYDETQSWFADRNISSVDAYRAGFANDSDRLFTSWSASYGGIRHDSGRIIRHAVLPAKQILSIPPTGFGTLTELEIVFIGYVKDIDSTAYKGGPGSGHHGHAGRPGKIGGSLPGKGSLQDDFGPFGNDFASYTTAYNYITNNRDGRMNHPSQIFAHLHNANVYKRDYKADTQGIEIFNPGTFTDSGEYIPAPPTIVTPEQFKYVYRNIEQKAKERAERVQYIAGIDDWVLDGFDISKSYYEAYREQDLHSIMEERAAQIEQNIKGYGYELYDFSAYELEYAIFDKIATPDDEHPVDKRDSYLSTLGDYVSTLQEFDTKHAITLGDINPEDARELGISGAVKPQNKEWEFLPDTLYHAATNSEAIAADQIRSRRELKQRSGVGLGGGEDDTISFGDSEDVVKNIERALQEAHMVANGKISIADMVEISKAGGLTGGKSFEEDFAYMIFGRDVGTFDDIKSGSAFADLLEAEKVGGTTEFPLDVIAEKRWDIWNYKFVKAREVAGGPPDPLFFGTDWKSLAKLDPENIATLKYSPKKNAKGYRMGSLSEWRLVGGDAVVLEEIINHYGVDDFLNVVGWTK